MYLVCYYGPAGRACVCSNYHAAVEETANNGGSGARGLGQRDALGVEGRIAVVVGEVEAAHGGLCVDVGEAWGVWTTGWIRWQQSVWLGSSSSSSFSASSSSTHGLFLSAYGGGGGDNDADADDGDRRLRSPWCLPGGAWTASLGTVICQLLAPTCPRQQSASGKSDGLMDACLHAC